MKGKFSKKMFVVCLIGLVIVVAGRSFYGCDWSETKKYEKTIELQAPLQAGSTLEAETEFGSVAVEGNDVAVCSVTAEICVQAPTEAEAIEIAEQVQIRLEPGSNRLTIEADKPRVKNNRSIGISYKITIPRQTNIEAASSYGSVNLSGIKGSVDASTSFGSIGCRDIDGGIKLETAYGSVDCNEIAFDAMTVHSSFGGVNIKCSDEASADMQADISTDYGSINFKAPTGFAGEVDVSTSYGSVETALPVTLEGKISNRQMQGVIGEGDGSLRLKTSFGSVKLR